MWIKYFALPIMMSPYDLSAGGICSVPKVREPQRRYSFSSAVVRPGDENALIVLQRRTAEIQDAVSKIPLPRIFVIHVRSTTKDFSLYGLEPEEESIFRAAIKKRYDDNRVIIEAAAAESIELYRRNVLAPVAHKRMHSRRRRRFAWKRTDFDAATVAMETAREGKEEKYPIAETKVEVVDTTL